MQIDRSRARTMQVGVQIDCGRARTMQVGEQTGRSAKYRPW